MQSQAAAPWPAALLARRGLRRLLRWRTPQCEARPHLCSLRRRCSCPSPCSLVAGCAGSYAISSRPSYIADRCEPHPPYRPGAGAVGLALRPAPSAPRWRPLCTSIVLACTMLHCLCTTPQCRRTIWRWRASRCPCHCSPATRQGQTLPGRSTPRGSAFHCFAVFVAPPLHPRADAFSIPCKSRAPARRCIVCAPAHSLHPVPPRAGAHSLRSGA